MFQRQQQQQRIDFYSIFKNKNGCWKKKFLHQLPKSNGNWQSQFPALNFRAVEIQ